LQRNNRKEKKLKEIVLKVRGGSEMDGMKEEKWKGSISGSPVWCSVCRGEMVTT